MQGKAERYKSLRPKNQGLKSDSCFAIERYLASSLATPTGATSRLPDPSEPHLM